MFCSPLSPSLFYATLENKITFGYTRRIVIKFRLNIPGTCTLVKNSTLNQERDIKGQMERIQSIKILWTIRRTIRSRSILHLLMRIMKINLA